MVEANALLRQMQVLVAEKARNVSLLEMLIAEFESMANSLAREIAAEEARTRIKDPRHVAYSPLAQAITQRRNNLLISSQDAKLRLGMVRRELDAITAKLRGTEEGVTYWQRGVVRSEQEKTRRQGGAGVL
jgi:hypothetical protein